MGHVRPFSTANYQDYQATGNIPWQHQKRAWHLAPSLSGSEPAEHGIQDIWSGAGTVPAFSWQDPGWMKPEAISMVG